MLYLTAVLVAGLVAGALSAFFLGQIRDVFTDVISLKERYDYAVLGTVSAIVSAGDRRKRLIELGCFGLVFLGLVGAYAGLMAIEIIAKTTAA